MFDIGWSELLVIGVVALVAIGPKELPGVLRSLGHWMGKIRRMASEFQNQFQEAMREAEMADLKKHADDLNSISKTLTTGIDPYNIMRDVAAETKPAAAATTGKRRTGSRRKTPLIPLDPPALQESGDAGSDCCRFARSGARAGCRAARDMRLRPGRLEKSGT